MMGMEEEWEEWRVEREEWRGKSEEGRVERGDWYDEEEGL